MLSLLFQALLQFISKVRFEIGRVGRNELSWNEVSGFPPCRFAIFIAYSGAHVPFSHLREWSSYVHQRAWEHVRGGGIGAKELA